MKPLELTLRSARSILVMVEGKVDPRDFISAYAGHRVDWNITDNASNGLMVSGKLRDVMVYDWTTGSTAEGMHARYKLALDVPKLINLPNAPVIIIIQRCVNDRERKTLNTHPAASLFIAEFSVMAFSDNFDVVYRVARAPGGVVPNENFHIDTDGKFLFFAGESL